MADFGFVGSAYSAPSIYQDAQECINWYLERDPTKSAGDATHGADRGIVALYPTPGLIQKIQLAVGEVRGLHVFSGGQILLAVSSSTLYSIDSSLAATSIGTLSSSAGQVFIKDNGLQAMIVDGNSRYSWVKATNVFSSLADGPFLGGGTLDAIDNYFIYTNPNGITWAATDTLNTTTPDLSVGQLLTTPNNIKALAASNSEVFLLGEISGEAWADTGSFPFPFQRIPGTSHQFGCASPATVRKFGPSFAWLAKNERGQAIVMSMQGYQPIRISTHAVEYSLLNQRIDDAIAYTYQLEGHEMYVLTFPSADLTWVYDLSTTEWHKWLSYDLFNTYHRHRSNCGILFQGLNLVGDYQNGIIYQLDKSTYTDNGAIIRRLRRCPHITKELQRVYHQELQIQFQPGVGLNSGQGSNPKAMIRWSNDGGSTWSMENDVSIGLIGNYRNRCIQRRMGWARDRIYEVSISDPVNAVIISANLKAEGGAN